MPNSNAIDIFYHNRWIDDFSVYINEVGEEKKFGVSSSLVLSSLSIICNKQLIQNSVNYYSLLIKMVEGELYHPAGPPASETILYNDNLFSLKQNVELTIVDYSPSNELTGLGNIVILFDKVGLPIGFDTNQFGQEVDQSFLHIYLNQFER